MKECRYCKRPMKEETEVCMYCGFDHKTGTISQAFKMPTASDEKSKKTTEEKEQKTGRLVSPKVKKFVFMGIIILAFSIFYRHNFSISSVVSEFSKYFPKLKMGKFAKDKSDKKKDKMDEKIELTNVTAFEEKKAAKDKNLRIEGIFFDPGGRSFVTIDGNVFCEGENIENILIKKINKDSVEAVVDGQSKIFDVNQSISLPVNK